MEVQIVCCYLSFVVLPAVSVKGNTTGSTFPDLMTNTTTAVSQQCGEHQTAPPLVELESFTYVLYGLTSGLIVYAVFATILILVLTHILAKQKKSLSQLKRHIPEKYENGEVAKDRGGEIEQITCETQSELTPVLQQRENASIEQTISNANVDDVNVSNSDSEKEIEVGGNEEKNEFPMGNVEMSSSEGAMKSLSEADMNKETEENLVNATTESNHTNKDITEL